MYKLVFTLGLIGVTLGANHPLCGQTLKKLRTDNYVVGGVNAEPGEWPWQVSLEYLSDTVGWYHTCGASVISENWVLTAAHCTDRSSDGRNYRVIVGEHDFSVEDGKKSTLEVTQVIQHPSWDSNAINNDVALLRLARPLNFNGNESHIRPVCLPTPQTNIDSIVGTPCWATGWGHTQWQGQIPNILQKVQVNVVQQSTCRLRYLIVVSITNSMICFGENGKGTCQGDSGGPLNCQVGGLWYSYGATSFGVQCAGPTYPSVSARVSELSTWIWSVAV